VIAIVSGLLSLGSAANATTYLINRVIGAGTVTGYIETDETTGNLSSGNIIDWSLTLAAPNLNTGTPYTIDFATAEQTTIASGVVASATQLIFDFSVFSNSIFLQGAGEPANPGGRGNFWLLSGTDGEDFGFGISSTYAQSVTGQTGRVVFASVAATPLPSALPLFATGLGALSLLGWRRKRKAKVAV
jgi:hypothetical protein